MSILSRFQSLYLRYFSKPRGERLVFQLIERHSIRRIVELGIGRGERARRMIAFARQVSPGQEIFYVGMDRFEAREEADGPGLSLKEAHQRLRGTGAKIQLVPGNLSDGLIRNANSLGKVDLLILPAGLDSPGLERLWFFVPRILHEQSVVLVERRLQDGCLELRLKPREEIKELATRDAARRAA